MATTLRGWLTARGFIARSRTLALARDSRAVDVVMVRGTHHVRYFRGGGGDPGQAKGKYQIHIRVSIARRTKHNGANKGRGRAYLRTPNIVRLSDVAAKKSDIFNCFTEQSREAKRCTCGFGGDGRRQSFAKQFFEL